VNKLFYFSVVLVLIFASCKKASTPAPAPPVISFASFTTSDATNGILTFNFSDADGDIGLNQEDTTGLYATNTVGYYDFYMRYFYLDSTGNYVKFFHAFNGGNPIEDSAKFLYRIPFVVNNIKSKTLDGQIIINLNGYKPANTALYRNFRYEFYIYDRALHKSNVVTTPGFSTPY
jgi:hypothetical protein